MNQIFIRITAATFVALLSQVPTAQAASEGVSRAEIKAETRAAEKAGALTPAGQGLAFTVPRTTDKTREQRKTETLAARKQGLLRTAGPADDFKADNELRAQRTTVNRAARKAETRAAEKAGLLTTAGEGPGAPKK